jgi:hypothetical protein
MRLIIYLVLLFTSLTTLAQVDKKLQDQLVEMAQQNQQVRQRLEKYNAENTPPALQNLASQINKLHTQTLKEMITLHGWPTKNKVGEKGIQASLTLLQHSKDLVFQQNMLPLIIQSFLDKGGIAAKDVAQFKQVFGTQAEVIDGKVIFAPIKNEDSVDPLRAQMGMSTLAAYKKTLETHYGLQK